MKNLLLGCLFVFLLISCGKNDGIVGTYNGTYDEYNCAPNATVQFNASNASVSITEVSTTSFNVIVSDDSDQLFDFNISTETDSTYTIVDFEQDGKSYIGNVEFSEDNLEIRMNDGCFVLGTQTLTNEFKGRR